MKKRNTPNSRRTFLQQSALLGGFLPFTPYLDSLYPKNAKIKDQLKVHVFSKHLQFLDYQDMAAAAADIGFDGVDLTVRPGGHVQPEDAVKHLPKAVAAIKNKGLQSVMMASGINQVNPLNKTVLETAAGLGIEYYRMSYFRYPKEGSMPKAIQGFKKHMKELSDLNKSLGIQGTYQNHAGGAVGAAIWEVWQLLEDTDKDAMGSQYDIRHAMVEGGGSWKNGLRLIQERINTIVIKDFRWKKVDGKWKIFNTPLGEGMVDFVAYFKLLKQYGINVPASLHLEYDLYGAEKGRRDLDKASQKKVLEAMKRDLELVHQWWKEA